MHNYLELKIWQQSRKLVKQVYQLVDHLPKSQLYGLTNQMQRAAVSIPSNIAEGAGRHTNKEFIRFLAIANGSAFELETQLFLCIDLNFLSKDDVLPVITDLKEIQKMNYRLCKTLESKS